MKHATANARQRATWLGGALLATLLAAQWVAGEDGSTDVEPTVEDNMPRRQSRATKDEPANQVEELQIERLDRRKFSAQAGDIFGPQSWVPPPSPSAVKSVPKPPPLQFKYLGKVVEGDETRVFLSLADRNYIVKAGETINGQYRMDEVSDHAITLTYLPLGAKQMLATAGAAAGGTGTGDIR